MSMGDGGWEEREEALGVCVSPQRIILTNIKNHQ